MKKAVRVTHTERCRYLTKALDMVNWCAGNGGCGSSSCKHDKVRSARIEAHKECEASLKKRILKHQQITSNDGKGRAAGD